ncbi:TRAP transporter substrate-binding protein DctP [Pseudomonas sp. MPG01]
MDRAENAHGGYAISLKPSSLFLIPMCWAVFSSFVLAHDRPFIIDVAIPDNPTFNSSIKSLKESLRDVAEVRIGRAESAGEAVTKVLNGEVGVAIVPISALTKLAPALQAYELPFTFSNYQAFGFSQESSLSEKATKQLKEIKISSLGGIWYGGSKVFVSKLPRRSPGDFKDAVVAVSDESGDLKGWSDVGAKTIAMSDAQMVSALSEGRIDAAEMMYSQLSGLKSGYVAQTDHSFLSLIAIRKLDSPFFLMSSKDNERITQAIEKARKDISINTSDVEWDTVEAAPKNPQITWIDFDTDERKDWHAAIAKSEASLIKQIGAGVVDEIRRGSVPVSLSKTKSTSASPMPAPYDRDFTRSAVHPPLSINWNAWFQSSPEQLRSSLVVGKPYEFLLDLGRGFYPGALGGAISSRLSQEIASQSSEVEVQLVIRPILLGSTLKFAPAETLRAQTFKVRMNQLGSKAGDESLREKARQKTLSLNDLAVALSVDKPLAWSLIARRPGCAQIALSIWDASGLRPLDYIVVSIPVNKLGQTQESCETGLKGGRLVSGIDHLMDLGRWGEQQFKADAALHLFDSIPVGEGPPSTVAVLVDRAAYSTDGTIYAWELGSDWKQFQEKMLPNALVSTHKRLRSAQPYSQVVQQFSNAFFSGKEPEDQVEADGAQVMLRKLGLRQDNPVLLVRYFDPWGEMQSLPLGLLGANVPKRLFSERVTVVQPLQGARQTDQESCFSAWDFAIPKKLDDVGADSAELLMKEDWRVQGTDIKWYQNNNDLFDFVMQPGSTTLQSSALLLLAHYGNGGITFSKSGLPDQVLSTDIRRRFVPGSIAILAACSTLGAAAADRTFVDMLVDRGVGAVIASPFFVDSDFGTRLSVSFVSVVKELRASASTASLMDIFNQAMQKTIDAYGKNSGYADMALEFQIIGDPQLKMCKAPLASNDSSGEQP